MRGRLTITITIMLLLAACSKVPESGETPDIGGNASAGVAFTYGYMFELPSRAIGALQEAHARACERVGTATCRITGLSYTVNGDGEAHASLSMKVAAPVARRFGRAAVVGSAQFGAVLVGAQITGDEVQPTVDQASSARHAARTDLMAIDRNLARTDLPDNERAQLRAQRAERIATARVSAETASVLADRLANTPMSFTYQPGHGVGLGNALRDSADTALSSSRATLIGATWLLAFLGPPAVLLVLLWLAWRRVGRRLWQRAVGDPAD